MRLPIRKSSLLKDRTDETEIYYLTVNGFQHLKDELEDLEFRQKPKAIEDVSQAVQKGDLSENAEYQEARSRLSRIEGRIFSLKERYKRVSIISSDGSKSIQLGSTVILKVNHQHKTYFIVGPHESNPSAGRISHLSPLGSALLTHQAGETVTFSTPQGEAMYEILEVR